MRVLMINKFLYPNGGSETYIFKLGEYLQKMGHEVQYFGMEHQGRCVGNRVNAYTSDMDFHGGSKISKLTYPLKTIYSREARIQIRKVLDDFQPDVCHLNNFNYQLTPSIILEIVKWRKKTGKKCRIVFTAHDYQLVCPNHMMNNPNTCQNCEKCLGGHFVNCMKGKCIHGSTVKSAVGMMEAEFWKWKGTYKYVDAMICCSEFMKGKMPCNGTKDKEVMGNLNIQSWEELWNSPQAEEVRKKVRCCDRDCWMIGSVSPAMHKYIWKPAAWVFVHKFKALFIKHPYSMYELKICRDYRDDKVTKDELDKCSTCDMNCVIDNGLSEASKEQLKHKTGEEIVDADIAEQMGK